MIVLPFDVNNSSVRQSFLHRHLPEVIENVSELPQAPQWGKMSLQHVLEHLTWAFRISEGLLIVPCTLSPDEIVRMKKFLYSNRPSPHDFRNPLLGDTPPALHFANLAEAAMHLREDLGGYIEHFRLEPNAVHTHMVFGPLGAAEWERVHYKHCFHHLLQFGLIGEAARADEVIPPKPRS